MSDTRQIKAAFPLDSIHPDIACGYGGVHERCDLHRLCDEHDTLLAACEQALSYMRDSKDIRYTEAFARTMGELRAAIAKAGGGNG